MADPIIATAQQINDRIDALATEIIHTYIDDKPLFLCLLRGGVPFASKLMFAISRQDPTYYPQLEYITARTYGTERQARATTEVTGVDEHVFAGRHVVILDDVLDTGQTPHTVEQWLRKRGAAQVDLVVLAQKDKPRTYWPQATLYGFLTADVWLSGMGCDNTSLAVEADRWNESLTSV